MAPPASGVIRWRIASLNLNEIVVRHPLQPRAHARRELDGGPVIFEIGKGSLDGERYRGSMIASRRRPELLQISMRDASGLCFGNFDASVSRSSCHEAS